jgi:hypothetical protein
MHIGLDEIDQLTRSIWGKVLGWEVERVEPAYLTGELSF